MRELLTEAEGRPNDTVESRERSSGKKSKSQSE